jgi:gluconokinase
MVTGLEAHRPYPVQTTPDGGVTIDPNGLLDDTFQCIDAVLGQMPAGRAIASVACDTFWHSLMGVSEEGRALTPMFTWADTRSSEAAKDLGRQLDVRAVHTRTGCVLHSSYLPAKLRWLGETQPELVRSACYWMSFAEFLYLQLFGERRVSFSMASATGLFDQDACRWDEEVIGVLPIDQNQLSPLAEFTDYMSGLRKPFESRWPGLQGVPWYLALGDGACNNVGSGGFRDDWVVVMIGTSGAIRVVRVADRSEPLPGLWTYRVDGKRFVQGGALSDGGNVFAWLNHTLQLPAIEELERQLSGMAPDAHGLTVLPFLAGERSPNWNPDARSAVVGMTLATTPIEIVRASMEAVAYRVGIVYESLKRNIPGTRGIIGSGAGLIHSPAWLQMMTDVLGEPMSVSAVPEASSRGAALLVLESRGMLADLADAPAPLGVKYQPDEARAAIYRAGRERQQSLYSHLFENDLTSGSASHRGEYV